MLIYLTKAFLSKAKSVLKFCKITSFISILCFIISITIDNFDGYIYLFTGINVFNSKHNWLIVTSNIFFGIASEALYLFIFGRLYFTFYQSNKYYLRKNTVIFVSGLIILHLLAMVFYVSILGSALLSAGEDVGLLYKWANYAFQVLLFCAFTLNSTITWLFVYKLQQLMLVRKQSNDGNEQVFNKMVTVMTKYTILTIVMIVFNVFFYIGMIIGSNYAIPGSSWGESFNGAYWLGYSNCIKAMYGLSVTSSIYLNFNFNKDLYFAVCSNWHWCCFGLFASKTREEIQRSMITHNNKVNLENVQTTKK